MKALCEKEELLIVSNSSISNNIFNIRTVTVSRKGFSFHGEYVTIFRLQTPTDACAAAANRRNCDKMVSTPFNNCIYSDLHISLSI